MFCTSCGKKIEDNVQFCTNCGSINPVYKEKKQMPPVIAIFKNKQRETGQVNETPITKEQQEKSQQEDRKDNKIIPPFFFRRQHTKQNQNHQGQHFNDNNRPEKEKNSFLFVSLIAMLIIFLVMILIYSILKAPFLTWIIAIIIIAIFSVIIVTSSKKDKLTNIVSLVIVIILISGNYVITTKLINNSNGSIIVNSSIVSQGVENNDLGNIISGQYYFDDGKNQFYSTFDENDNPHIYRSSNKGNEGEAIFDGFGWSLVFKDNWLYFSGNQGKAIDGTYNLFRMRADGTELEVLNHKYCYGMNIYGNWIYYMGKSSVNDPETNIYRSDVDGENETLLVSGSVSSFIVYKDELYYLDSEMLYNAKPDGSATKIITDNKAKAFIIGSGKIIYIGTDNSVNTMSVIGNDVKEIKPASGDLMITINSYNDRIYYVVYDEAFNYTTYSYKYWVYSIDFKGKNNKQLYEGDSFGFYINVVDNKLFVLDYLRDSSDSKLVVTTKNMTLDGANLKILAR